MRFVSQAQGNVMAPALLAPSVHKLVHGSRHADSTIRIANIENISGNRLSRRVDKFKLRAGRKLCQVE